VLLIVDDSPPTVFWVFFSTPIPPLFSAITLFPPSGLVEISCFFLFLSFFLFCYGGFYFHYVLFRGLPFISLPSAFPLLTPGILSFTRIKVFFAMMEVLRSGTSG